MEGNQGRGFSVDAGWLKLIAIIAMTVDHIGWAFFDTFSKDGQIMHFIGRLTFPIMAFFIAEGYYRTHDLKKYLTRLGVFALISHIPFQLFIYGTFVTFSRNPVIPLEVRLQTGVIYTLFLGLLALYLVKRNDIPWFLKSVIIILICFISIPGDYSYYGVLLILAFGLFRHDEPKKYLFSVIIISALVLPRLRFTSPVSIFMLGTYVPLILIKFYNGNAGFSRKIKWLLYIYYPLHLIILFFLRKSIMPGW